MLAIVCSVSKYVVTKKSVLQWLIQCLVRYLQPPPAVDTEDGTSRMWQQLAEVITPSIVKVVDFAKHVPGFETVSSIPPQIDKQHDWLKG